MYYPRPGSLSSERCINPRGAGSSLLTVGIICVISNKAELLDFSDSNNNTQGSHSRGDIMTRGQCNW